MLPNDKGTVFRWVEDLKQLDHVEDAGKQTGCVGFFFFRQTWSFPKKIVGDSQVDFWANQIWLQGCSLELSLNLTAGICWDPGSPNLAAKIADFPFGQVRSGTSSLPGIEKKAGHSRGGEHRDPWGLSGNQRAAPCLRQGTIPKSLSTSYTQEFNQEGALGCLEYRGRMHRILPDRFLSDAVSTAPWEGHFVAVNCTLRGNFWSDVVLAV